MGVRRSVALLSGVVLVAPETFGFVRVGIAAPLGTNGKIAFYRDGQGVITIDPDSRKSGSPATFQTLVQPAAFPLDVAQGSGYDS